jgi:hypothetical protein
LLIKLPRFNTPGSLTDNHADGIRFPFPIPTHPEHLNDVGMLRMQVRVRISYYPRAQADFPAVLRAARSDECDVWVKIKVCMYVCMYE